MKDSLSLKKIISNDFGSLYMILRMRVKSRPSPSPSFSIFEKIDVNNIYKFTLCLFFLSVSNCIYDFVMTLLLITFVTLKNCIIYDW
jgi:hypothetical protein